MPRPDPVICAPLRTAIGTFGGSLKDMPATELGAIAIRATLDLSGLSADQIDTVIMGQVLQAGARMNPARQAALGAGLPVSVPAMTVNRVCGSGAQAVITAAQEVMLGHTACAIAGGMENMDQAPFLLGKARYGYRLGDGAVIDSLLNDGLNDAFSGEHSGWHTEDLVRQNKVSRAAQDAWALRSPGFPKPRRRAGSKRKLRRLNSRHARGPACLIPMNTIVPTQRLKALRASNRPFDRTVRSRPATPRV